MNNIVGIVVYRDTIERHDDDNNISCITVTKEFAEQYFNECIRNDKKRNTFDGVVCKTFEEYCEYYTCDDVDDFYDYAKEHNAIIDIENW